MSGKIDLAYAEVRRLQKRLEAALVRALPLTYLAVPYTTDDTRLLWERYRAANKAAAYLFREGHHVISPISHCHQIIMDHELPKEWEFWEKYDRSLLSCCKLLIVLKLPGWEESVGVQAEIKIAQETGVPVEYLELEEIGMGEKDDEMEDTDWRKYAKRRKEFQRTWEARDCEFCHWDEEPEFVDKDGHTADEDEWDDAEVVTIVSGPFCCCGERNDPYGGGASACEWPCEFYKESDEKAEAEADEDIENGRLTGPFKTPEELIESLKSDDVPLDAWAERVRHDKVVQSGDRVWVCPKCECRVFSHYDICPYCGDKRLTLVGEVRPEDDVNEKKADTKKYYSPCVDCPHYLGLVNERAEECESCDYEVIAQDKKHLQEELEGWKESQTRACAQRDLFGDALVAMKARAKTAESRLEAVRKAFDIIAPNFKGEVYEISRIRFVQEVERILLGDDNTSEPARDDSDKISFSHLSWQIRALQELQRWKMFTPPTGTAPSSMTTEPDGEWVRYSDIEEILSADTEEKDDV